LNLSLAKFLLKLGLGVTSLLFGAIGLALGLSRILFWQDQAFYQEALIATIAGFIALVVGIALLLFARKDLENPDLMQAMFKRTKWTNIFCPTCLWWMRDEYEGGVRVWHCVNPEHSGTRPVVKP
jgi:amino acid transporter